MNSHYLDTISLRYEAINSRKIIFCRMFWKQRPIVRHLGLSAAQHSPPLPSLPKHQLRPEWRPAFTNFTATVSIINQSKLSIYFTNQSKPFISLAHPRNLVKPNPVQLWLSRVQVPQKWCHFETHDSQKWESCLILCRSNLWHYKGHS